jgi:hypothetical protein
MKILEVASLPELRDMASKLRAFCDCSDVKRGDAVELWGASRSLLGMIMDLERTPHS